MNGGGVTTPVRGTTTANFVNPAADMNRRIGAPGAPGGFIGGGMQNRSAYRPPTSVGVKRPALADVSNTANGNGVGQQMDGPADAKKAKVDPVVGGKAAGDAAAGAVAVP